MARACRPCVAPAVCLRGTARLSVASINGMPSWGGASSCAARRGLTIGRRCVQDHVFRATSAQFLADSTRRQLDSFAALKPATSFSAPFEAWADHPAAAATAARASAAAPATSEMPPASATQRLYAPGYADAPARPSSAAQMGATVRRLRAPRPSHTPFLSGFHGFAVGQRAGTPEPIPGADVAGVSPVPVQMCQECAESQCRCGRGEPSPGTDSGR